MTPQQSIEQAAKEYAKESTAPDKETPTWIEQDFKAGADFVLQHPELMQEPILSFVDWLTDNYDYHAGVWLNVETKKPEDIIILFTLYLEHIKQKQ
jgi:hypothetical protein